MSNIISKLNKSIDELQSMAAQLADCDPDGDRTLEEVLQPFLISACIGMLEEMDVTRADQEEMLQYILDCTVLGMVIPYDAEQVYRNLDHPGTDAYQTLYGMANGWDMPGNTVGWQVFTMMAVYFERPDIAEMFIPKVIEFMHDIGDLLDEVFFCAAADRAYLLYMGKTTDRLNQVLKDQFGMEKDLFSVDISFDGANEFTDSGDNLEMEEMLDDWIIANGDNPYDIDTRFDAIKDPFGFADKD